MDIHRVCCSSAHMSTYKAHDKHSVSLSWDSAVVDVLSEGYDIHYGARSIKHEVCLIRHVKKKIATMYCLRVFR